MKKTFTLLMLTLFLSVLAFAQKRERPMPVLQKTSVAQKMPKKQMIPVSVAKNREPVSITNHRFSAPPQNKNFSSKKPLKAPKKAPSEEGYYYSFSDGTLGVWTAIDADGDGNNWEVPTSGVQGRDGKNGSCAVSKSYENGVGALKPDNYLVSPKMALDGSITFWAKGQDATYCKEHFGVAVSTNGNTSDKEFTIIKEWTATSIWTEYTVD